MKRKKLLASITAAGMLASMLPTTSIVAFADDPDPTDPDPSEDTNFWTIKDQFIDLNTFESNTVLSYSASERLFTWLESNNLGLRDLSYTYSSDNAAVIEFDSPYSNQFTIKGPGVATATVVFSQITGWDAEHKPILKTLQTLTSKMTVSEVTPTITLKDADGNELNTSLSRFIDLSMDDLGKTRSFSATLENITTDEIEWESSVPDAVSVEVDPLDPLKATITAHTVRDTSVSISCQSKAAVPGIGNSHAASAVLFVFVKPAVASVAITTSKNGELIDALEINESIPLTADAFDEDNTKDCVQGVDWTITAGGSNAEIVEGTGRDAGKFYLKGVADGTVTVKAASKVNPDKFVTKDFTVNIMDFTGKPPATPMIDEESVTLDSVTLIPPTQWVKTGDIPAGCTLEYAKSETRKDMTPEGGFVWVDDDTWPDAVWQTSPTFTGLEAGKTYYFYARVKATEHLNTVSRVSLPASRKMASGAISDSDLTLNTEGAELEYTGYLLTKPTVTVKKGETTLRENTDYTVAYYDANGRVWDGGSAGTITVKAIGKNDYCGTATATYTVAKAKPTVAAPTAASLTFNGTDQVLLTTGATPAPSYLDVNYKLDSGAYGAALPFAKDAGEYTVTYKALGDENHTDSDEATVTVTIAQAPAKTLAAKELTLNAVSAAGNAQTLSLAGLLPADAGTITYEVGDVTDAAGIINGEPTVSSGTLSFTAADSLTAGTSAVIPVTIKSTNYANSTININVSTTDLATQAAPSCTLTIAADDSESGKFKATITAVEGAEYRFDNETAWSSTNVKTGIAAGTTVTAYIRMAAVEGSKAASPAASAVQTTPYAIAAPVLPSASHLVYGTTIEITCATPGAIIYYTTDGSTPTSSSTRYTDAGITVPSGVTEWTLKAIATKTDYSDSAVVSKTYSIYEGNPSTAGGGGYAPRPTEPEPTTSTGSYRPAYVPSAGKTSSTTTSGSASTGFSTALTTSISSASKGDKVSISGASAITATQLTNAASKGVTLEVKVNDTYTWEIDPSAVESTSTALDLKIGSVTVSNATVARDVFGSVEKSIGFSVNTAKPGKGAKLSINTGVKPTTAKPMFANLYKTDANGKMIFASVAKIDADGKAILPIEEAGKYTVCVSDETKMYGDLDNNCGINIKDATASLEVICGITDSDKFNIQKLDVDGNGIFNIGDVTAVLNLIVGKKTIKDYSANRK